jgi:hypothetical protein
MKAPEILRKNLIVTLRQSAAHAGHKMRLKKAGQGLVVIMRCETSATQRRTAVSDET